MATPQERELLLRHVDMALRARDLARAAALAEEGLALGIEHPGLLNLAAHNAIERGDFDRAIGLLERARLLAPTDVHVLNTLGIALKRAGRWEDAASTFDAAIAADGAYANAHFNKGTVLEGLDARADAEAAYQRAVALEPDFADALGRLSYLAAMRGDYDAAVSFGERAIAGRTGEPPPALNLAQFAQLRGDHVAAQALAARVLERDPSDAAATLTLSAAEIGLGEGANAMPRLRALLADPATTSDARSRAFGLIGKVEEQAGNAKPAFAAFTESKEELVRAYAAKYTTPDGTEYASRVARMLQYFRDAPASQWAAHRSAPHAAPDGPREHVFLVGFPRSGTTLLEKCLSGHPDIATMEEEESFALAAQDFFFPADGFARLAELTGGALDTYREAYWRICRAAVPRLAGKVFIDKMPLNTVFLPFVAKFFPDAKILFALRDSRDVVLSCLKQQFAMSAAMYEFTTLEGAARLYDLVMQLGAIYREKLDLAIMDTRYEDLIAGFDAAMRRICDFLGLEWNASMHDAAAASSRTRLVRTPSAPQVARSLYDGSGQWRRYREEMAMVLPLLAPWAAKFGYPAG